MANIDNGVILGALGSTIQLSGTSDTIFPPTGMVIASIQFVGDCKINTLIAETPTKTFNTSTTVAHDLNDPGAVGGVTVDQGGGGDRLTPDTPLFPAGTVIYGRWTSAQFSSNDVAVICYFGY